VADIREYATPGNTGLLVSKLCFGTVTSGDGRGLLEAIRTVDRAGADELVMRHMVRSKYNSSHLQGETHA
jgi:aryl-alcohol dehydrogenase-like predicted oxidoreductase